LKGSDATKKSDWVADFDDNDEDILVEEGQKVEEDVSSPKQLSGQDEDVSDEQQSPSSDNNDEEDEEVDVNNVIEEDYVDDDGGEVSWFVDVTGNPLEVALVGDSEEAVETQLSSTTVESCEQLQLMASSPNANSTKRKRLIDHTIEKLTLSQQLLLANPSKEASEIEMESSLFDIVIQEDSDDEVVFQAHFPKPIKPQPAVKVQLEEDLVVQYFDQSNLCVATSSAKRRRSTSKVVEVVDLVSDSDPDTVVKLLDLMTDSKNFISSLSQEVPQSEMDFSNLFNEDSVALLGRGRKRYITSSEFGVATADESKQKHRKQRNLLRDLLTHLKVSASIELFGMSYLCFCFQFMDWMQAVDFRCKAKVPIINFLHKNGLQCDLSIGVTAQDTSEVVQRLKDSCGPTFAPLTAVLKVFIFSCY